MLIRKKVQLAIPRLSCSPARQGSSLYTVHCFVHVKPRWQAEEHSTTSYSSTFHRPRTCQESSQYQLAQETGVGSIKKYLRALERGKWASQSQRRKGRGDTAKGNWKQQKNPCRLLRFLKTYSKCQQEIKRLRNGRDFNSCLNRTSLLDFTVGTSISKNTPVLRTGYLSYFCWPSLVVEVTIAWKLL